MSRGIDRVKARRAPSKLNGVVAIGQGQEHKFL